MPMLINKLEWLFFVLPKHAKENVMALGTQYSKTAQYYRTKSH